MVENNDIEDCGLVEIDHIKNWIWVSDLALENVEELNQLIEDLIRAKSKIGWD